MSLSIAEQGTHHTFRIDEVIFKDEYLVTEPSIFLILSGEVNLVRKYTPLQKEVFTFSQGDLIGMLEVYTGGSRLTEAVARTEVQAMGFTRAQFEKNMLNNLRFAILAIRNLSKMLRQVNIRIKNLE